MKKDDEKLPLVSNAQMTFNERDRMYWLWLQSAYSILRSRVPDIFAYQSNLERSYGAAKQIVMELWAIRAFLIKLKIGTDHFDKLIPNLKAFRDAIAHIDERAEGIMLVHGVPARITRSKTSLAGGLLETIDGVRWSGFQFCYGLIGSSDGLYTTFGLIRDWIITNTDRGTVELQLTPQLFEQLDDFVRSIVPRSAD